MPRHDDPTSVYRKTLHLPSIRRPSPVHAAHLNSSPRPPPAASAPLLSENSTVTLAALHTLVSDFKKSLLFLKDHPLFSTSPSPPPITDTDAVNANTLLSKIYVSARDFLDIYKDRTSLLSPDSFLDFLATPRFDDPAYLTTLALLLAAVFITMSWFSRAGGSWGAGRFSPFGRTSSPFDGSGEVSDEGYSYITDEDLNRRDREHDVLVLKHGRTNYPVHFPKDSIRDGEVRVKDVRAAAARAMDVPDPARVRMFFKGRNLKVDERLAREEGLRGDGAGSEILCVVGEGSGRGSTMAPGSEDVGARQEEGSEDEEFEGGEGAEEGGVSAAGGKKKSRRRGKKNKKKQGGASSPTATHAYSNASSTPSEFLPIPSHAFPPRPSSSSAPSSQPSRAATPQTPLAKLEAIASKFHTELVPLCVQFMQNPPEEKSKRQFEYKKLSETILAQVLLKVDGVEAEGDNEVRTRRKELVREVQGMLGKLDETVKQ